MAITVADIVVDESNTVARFTVRLTAPSALAISVSYNITGFSAAGGTDFSFVSGTLNFAVGVTELTIDVPLVNNAVPEGLELFRLNLFSPVNTTIERESAWATIVDNDATTGIPVVRVSDRVVDEAAGTVTFALTLDKPSAGTVSVDYATANGTATAGLDYVALAAQTVSFLAGEVSKTVTVDLINDGTAEGREYFDLVLSAPVGATLLPQAHGRASIGANDAPAVGSPLITVSDAIAGEADGTLEFVVSLSAPSTQTVNVNYSTSNFTAANGSDFQFVSGTLTFAPGQTTQTVLVPVLDNTTLESVEFMTLNLTSATNGIIGRQEGWGTIVDNDATTGTPVVRVSDRVVDEAAGTVTFALTLDKPSAGTVSVDYATANGTATAGLDYVALAAQTVSFLAGEVSKTVTVDLINDGTAEGREYFDLVLSAPVGATLLPQAHGRASIGANDAPAVGSPLITVSDAIAGEADGTLEFVVSLSAPSTQTVNVNYSTSNFTAANGSDFQFVSGTLTFAPGQTTQTVLVPVLDNTTLESVEFMTLNLTSATNGIIGRQEGWGTIVDNDATTGTPVVRVSDRVVDEAAGTVTFALTLDKPSAGTVSVDYATANGTATAGLDYVALAAQTVSFLAGEVSKTVTVDLINDGTAEGREYFDLVLSAPVGATLLPQAHGRASIGANDAPAVGSPLITVSDAIAGEADGTLEFVVSLSAPSTQTVNVNYSTSNFTAANGSDFQFVSGTLTFAPGQTTQTVLVPVLDNTTLESVEFMTLNLTSATNGIIGRQEGWGTIVDNDATTGTPVVRVSDRVVDEAAGTVTFALTLDKPSAGTVSVDYATANGTATAGLDYVALAAQTVSFLAGEVSKTVTVDLINDGTAEGREYFDLVLSAPVGATLLPQARGRASIGANDAPAVGSPLITVSDAVAGEADGTLEFVVSLSAPSTQTVSVNYSTSNATALNGSDYQFVSGTLTFAPGQTTQTVLVPVLDNTTLESAEFMTLNLATPVNGIIARQEGWGTIVDNDATTGTPVVRVSDRVVDEAAGTVTFALTLDKPSAGTVSVDYATANGTATAGSDYVALAAQTLSFLAGEVSKVVTVDLINDGTAEPGEYFDVVLSAPGGVTIPDTNARTFIAPSDAPLTALPRITVSDAVAGESNGTLEFVVSLNAPSTQTVSVNYNNSNVTAANGSDYLAVSGTVRFAPGQTTQTIVVPVVDNTTPEATEYLTLNLATPVNGSIARQEGWGTIVDNDGVTGTPALSVSDGIVDESADRASFIVSLDRPSTVEVRVNYVTADGTAFAGTDYEPQGSQTLVFAPGEVSKTAFVNLRGDAAAELPEFFDLALTNPANATLSDGRGHMVIAQSDATNAALPVISAAAISASEGGGYIEFVVSLSAPSVQAVGVSYSNSNGTAASGSDYVFQSGVLSFTPGEVLQVVRIPVLDDAALETTETFTLNLFSPVNATIAGTPSVSASIVDNDGAPLPGELLVVGSANADVLIARPGANAVDGGQGNDLLDGVDGVAMSGGGGDDQFIVESSSDAVVELSASGTDTVVSYISYALGANVENLTLLAPALNGTGNELNNVIVGNAASNILIGNAGNDTLNGGTGADSMTGGDGNDTYFVDNAADTVIETNTSEPTGGSDAVFTTLASYTLGANLEYLRLQSNGAANGTGNALNNILFAGAGNNVLDGGAGNDTVSYAFASAAVSASLAIAGAQATGGSGSDTFIAIENLNGSSFNDTLLGNAAANALNGAAGADAMSGGDGSDSYTVDNAGDTVTETNASAATGGTDIVFSSLAAYTLGANVENLRLLATGAANATGNALNNVLYAGAGNNVLDGALGNDTVTYAFAGAAVSVSLAVAAAQATGGSGSDTLVGIENLSGSNFADTLSGNSAANTIDGGLGADAMNGGDGNDVYFVDHAADTVTESNASAATGGADIVFSTLAAYTLGANVENLRILSAGTANATGNALNNVLYAGAGNNVLDGGAGIDTAAYVFAGAGITASLAVAGAQATGGSGSDSFVSIENLTGSNFADTLSGNSAANTINGGTGIDAMSGGDGSDTYYVDHAADTVTETNASAATGGSDTVFSSLVAYTLGANLENLRLLAGGAADATGNALNNVLFAGAGNNVLDGGAGNDTVSYIYAGGAVTASLAIAGAQATLGSGSDTFIGIEHLAGSNSNDTLSGNGLANTLNGGLGADVLDGGLGADVLLGGLGNDTLTGGAGPDDFWFTTAPNGASNTDFIADFLSADDRIALDDAVFAGIGPVGALAASAFVIGTAAADASDRIIYNPTTGALLFDADGSGAGVAVQFASVTAGTAINVNDFFVF